jgi:addiction module HigA family antidote
MIAIALANSGAPVSCYVTNSVTLGTHATNVKVMKKLIKDFTPNWTVHPGKVLAKRLQSHGISQAELARRAGLTRKLVSQIINSKAPVSPNTALALGKVFEMEPIAWLCLQARYDLFEVKRRRKWRSRRRAAL